VFVPFRPTTDEEQTDIAAEQQQQAWPKKKEDRYSPSQKFNNPHYSIFIGQ
jgi:hypothetical protein